MANWCYTNYTFYGRVEDMVKFGDLIDSAASSGLYDCLTAAGLNSDDFRCRGAVIYCDYDHDEAVAISEKHPDDGYEIVLDTETAWVPMPLVWDAIIKTLGVDIKFCYMAEEPGMDLYEIYDPHCIGRYDGTDYAVTTCVEEEDAELLTPFLEVLGMDWYETTYFSCCDVRDAILTFVKSCPDLQYIEYQNMDIDELIAFMHNYEFNSEFTSIYISKYYMREDLTAWE